MAKVSLVYRMATPAAVSLARSLSAYLKEKGHDVLTAPEQKLITGTKKASTSDMAKSQLVIALGGDGTYLRAVRLLNGNKTPILGVNLGSLGFLTPTRTEEVFTSVEFALSGKMKSQPRSMIEVEILKKGKSRGKFLALNDVVMERGSLSQIINISVTSGKNLVSEVKADGIIVATPTGSTAYNLSAGGPILDPESKVFVVTPIAPHGLNSRPIIFPDNRSLNLKLVGKLHRAHLVTDGMVIGELTNDDEIIVRRSKSDHYMVCDPSIQFFSLLREKLRFGDR